MKTHFLLGLLGLALYRNDLRHFFAQNVLGLLGLHWGATCYDGILHKKNGFLLGLGSTAQNLIITELGEDDDNLPKMQKSKDFAANYRDNMIRSTYVQKS